MVYRLLAYLVEAGVLCQIWYIPVHLAIHLDVLHHILAVGFQSAVEVMQIMYSAYLPCRGVEELCRNGLGEGVALLAVHLVARNKVVAVFLYHAVELRNLVGRILQVGIHGDHHISFCLVESAIQSGTLTVVATEFYSLHILRILSAKLLYHIPRLVGGSVVHEYHLVCKAFALHHSRYPRIELRQ